MVALPITVGKYPTNATAMTDFLVVDCPIAFNTILGRPSLKVLKVITSIYHLTMKFPTSEGTGTVYESQLEAKECYNQAIQLANQGCKLPQVMMVKNSTNEKEQGDFDLRELNEPMTGPVEELYDL